MLLTSTLNSFLTQTLEPQKFKDYCHNGFQIEGSKQIKKIALGVSSSREFLAQAKNWGADACIVHHGVIFGKIDRVDDILKNRLKILIEGNINLFAYHLPLDAHEEVGNNSIIAKKLGLEDLQKVDIGYTGKFKTPLSFTDFCGLVTKEINQFPSFAENFGNEMVEKVCIISGGASGYSHLALESGADTFLFGELKESAYHEIKERNLNMVAAGHFATERFGVQALGEKIKKQFPEIEVQFFDEEILI